MLTRKNTLEFVLPDEAIPKSELIFLARLAEQAERFEEMCIILTKAIQKDSSLNIEERNLLSIAFRSAVGMRRTSWKTLVSIETRKNGKFTEAQKTSVAQYKDEIKLELTEFCNRIIELIESSLIPTAFSVESQVFYSKMRGDYYRYLSEVSDEEEKAILSQKADKSYTDATEIAESTLSPVNPVRLGLALNYSVFVYEIMNNVAVASSMAKKAFDTAISDIQLMPEEVDRDSTLVMHLLKDNLSFWNRNKEEPDLTLEELI